MEARYEVFGAYLERGEVIGADTGKWTVKSLDRVGIESPPLPSLSGTPYANGDIVLFSMFSDGTGIIIGKMG